jgi:beta-glucosidase
MHGQFPDDPAPINMATALSRGLVSQKAVDQAAYRVLHEMNRFGYLDGKTHQPTHLAPAPESEAIIAKTARDAAVLLKNEGGILPLTPSDMDGLALVGPGANQVVALGINAEHSLGIVATQRGTVDVLKERHPGKEIAFAVANDMTGTPIPASAWGEGLTRYQDGKPVGRDAMLDLTATSGKALPADSTLSWKGELTVPAAGTYGLYLQVLGSNAKLIVDGKPLSHTASMTGARHGDTVQAGRTICCPPPTGWTMCAAMWR